MEDVKILKKIDQKLSALIALSIFGKEEISRAKPEVILSNVGLETPEIARILGKALPAVRKSLQRAKK